MLFKENHPVLYDHFDLCTNRLEQLFKKLKNDKELLKKYDDVSAKQLKQGIWKKPLKIAKLESVIIYLIMPFFKWIKTLVKLQLFFDASARSEGPSLNDGLYKSPQLT